jgi:integrase/recombinase XerD
MAFVYRPKGRPKYFLRFKHPRTGQWVTKAGYADKAATKQLAARLEREAAQELEGIAPPAHARAPLAEHVTAFVAHLAAKGGTAKHAATRRAHVTVAAAGCRWSALGQLDGSALELWLAGRRRDDTEARAAGQTLKVPRFGARTSNHYLRSLKHFARWCVRTGRLPADPFAHVQAVNADADRRHERRALDQGEFAALLVATKTGPPRNKLTGVQRAVLYLTAAHTGLRARELASLTRASFDLDADPPTWTIAARSEKARRGDRLPLHPEAAAELRRYTRRVMPGAPLWPGPWAEQCAAAKMLKHDLAAAGIPYRTAEGVFDFHSLRVQFITNLARAGVSLQAAQRLARHCDPRLTASVYTRLGRADLAGELGKVPGVRPAE